MSIEAKVITKQQFKRGNKEALDKVLIGDKKPLKGEPIFETDTRRLKIGDGKSNYSDLPYLTSGDSNDLNIVNSIGLYSSTIKEEVDRQNEINGRASFGVGHKNKIYQADAFAAGNGNKVGMTEAEFNEYWPSHGGSIDPDTGKVKDIYGSFYEKAYLNSIVGGENSTVRFRDSVSVGYNCYNNATAAQTFGRNTKVSKENMMAIGQFNTDNSTDDNIFEIGNGDSDSARHNAFSVSRAGDAKVDNLMYANGFVSTKGSVSIGGHDFSFPSKNGSVALLADIDDKVDKELGKGLSSNDFTNALKSKLENMQITSKASTNTIPLRQANGSFKVGRYLVKGGVYRFTTLAKIDKLQIGKAYQFNFIATNRSQTDYIVFNSKDAQDNIIRMDYGALYKAYDLNGENHGWNSSDYQTITITGEADYEALGQDFLEWFEASTEIVSLPESAGYDDYDAVPKYLIDKKQDKFTIVKSITQTGVIATLQANTNYIYGELTSADLTFPTGEDNAEIDFMFTSGTTPTTLTLNGTNIAYDTITVEANKIVELKCKWYIDKWVILVSQTSVGA